MDFIEGIKSRRSIRKFTDEAVTKEQIEEIVDIARFAPSWKNSQSVRYLCIMDKAVKDVSVLLSQLFVSIQSCLSAI